MQLVGLSPGGSARAEVVWCGDPVAGGWVGLVPPNSLSTPMTLDGVSRKSQNGGTWKMNKCVALPHTGGGQADKGGARIPVPDTLVVCDFHSCTPD